MKKTCLVMLLAVSVGGNAHADYHCTDYGSEVGMTVNENHVTHLGDTSISLMTSSENTQLFGVIHSEGGILRQKKVVEFHPFQGDTLTIVSKPALCGRGSCDWDARPIFTAKLKIGETETYFSCNETNP